MKINQRCKSIVQLMRVRHRQLQMHKQFMSARPLTLDELQLRLEKANQPFDIVTVLRRLVAVDRDIESESKDAARYGAQQVLECGPPEINNSGATTEGVTEGASSPSGHVDARIQFLR